MTENHRGCFVCLQCTNILYFAQGHIESVNTNKNWIHAQNLYQNKLITANFSLRNWYWVYESWNVVLRRPTNYNVLWSPGLSHYSIESDARLSVPVDRWSLDLEYIGHASKSHGWIIATSASTLILVHPMTDLFGFGNWRDLILWTVSLHDQTTGCGIKISPKLFVIFWANDLKF